MSTERDTLRHDPEFAALFDDLDAVLDDHPLEPLRPAAPSPVPGRWNRMIAAFAAGCAALGLGLWATGDADLAVVAEAPRASVAPVTSAEPSAPVDVPAMGAPPVAAAPPARAKTPPVSATEPVAVETQAIPAFVEPPAAAEAVAPPAPGNLDAEERAYRPAEAALAAGDWSGAIAAADAYLSAFPDGRWVDKATLLHLDALVRAGRLDEVVAYSLAIEDRAALRSREGDLRRVRAEALAALGRCAEALAIAETLARGEGNAVRRICR